MKSTFFAYSKDKTLLSGCEWNSIRNPLAVLFYVHGLGEQVKSFDSLAKKFNKNRIVVFSIDLRGFGCSSEKRGQVDSLNEYLEDIDCGIKKLRSCYSKEVPLFLIGNSMGAIFALMYSLQSSVDIKGLIFLAPCFQLVKEPPLYSIWFYKIFNKGFPSCFYKDRLIKYVFFVKNKKQDNMDEEVLAHRHISARLFVEVYHKAKKFAVEKIHDLTFPIIIFHGDKDPITSFSACEKFSTLNHPWTTFVPIHGGEHNIHLGSLSNQIVDVSVDWIQQEIIKTI